MSRIRNFIHLGVALLVAGATGCSSSRSYSAASSYSEAFESLGKAVTKKGIPREKVFYQFQLLGVPSKRIGQSGLRGGSVTAWEEWQLPSGDKLVASKSTYLGNSWEARPYEEGDSPFVTGRVLMLKEEFYHEPRLEPFFDSVVLRTRAGEEIGRFDVPRK